MITLLLLCILPFCAVFADQVSFGNVRVQTLSPTLVRVENKGPQGFEDRTTFVVINRDFKGVPILSVNNTSGGVIVSTQYYNVFVSQVAPPTGTCYGQQTLDVNDPQRSPFFPDGLKVSSAAACCAACQTDDDCNGWVFDTQDDSVNCWPLNSWSSTSSTQNRIFGSLDTTFFSVITEIRVTDPKGNVLVDQKGVDTYSNLLHWPSPLSASAYVLTDYPRFFVPEWGPTPHMGIIDHPDTNGYDYTNNQNGDFYIFLLGSTLDSWFASRSEFVQLVGPTPVLPDFAFGTWFTYWHSYTEAEAKDDIAHWQQGGLPLDVYGLDMNWRNTSDLQDHFYSHPNTALFKNFTEWFEFLHNNKLKTYFNDHPFPVDMQTSPSEVGFRYGGLSEWMERGLDYWWFDHNWGFSIPPPNVLPVNGWSNSNTDGNWLGLDNAAWGSHVYFESVSQFYKAKGSDFRPMTLTKFARPDWRPNMPSTGHQEHPAHHRFPVWWTGDGVDLRASMQSMVDAGVHDFKPYVHSDCGGDYRGSGGDLVRWTGHCVLGTILRFHGDDHRPWTYDAHTEDMILSYLQMRYRLIPTLISAGQGTLFAGFPIVARGDLFWPDHSEAASNDQYIHLNTTLVAPIWDSTQNMTARNVWIPPGQWQDGWTGSVVTGPQTISVTKPYEQIPMWHRRGTFTITTDTPSTRVQAQDWTILTIQAFPHISQSSSSPNYYSASIFTLGDAVRTDLVMETAAAENGNGIVSFRISAAEDGSSRGWILRLHLLPGQHVISAVVDDMEHSVNHIAPITEETFRFFPFGVAGTPPARNAGKIAEIKVPQADYERELLIKVVQQ